MSTAELIAQLSAAARKLDEAQVKAHAAARDAEEAKALVDAALHGATAGPLLDLIEQLRESLSQVAARTPAVRMRVHETIQKAQALGN